MTLCDSASPNRLTLSWELSDSAPCRLLSGEGVRLRREDGGEAPW